MHDNFKIDILRPVVNKHIAGGRFGLRQIKETEDRVSTFGITNRRAKHITTFFKPLIASAEGVVILIRISGRRYLMHTLTRRFETHTG